MCNKFHTVSYMSIVSQRYKPWLCIPRNLTVDVTPPQKFTPTFLM